MVGEPEAGDAGAAVTTLTWSPAAVEPAVWASRNVSLAESDRLWVGAPDGLYRVQPSAVHQVAPPGGAGLVDAIWRDRYDGVWQHVPAHGWWSEGLGWLRVTGLPSGPSVEDAQLTEPAMRSAWVGLDRIYEAVDHQHPWRLQPLKGAPDLGTIRQLATVLSGYTWAVGERGLARWDGQAWVVVEAPAGGPLSGLRALQARADGSAVMLDDAGGVVTTDSKQTRRFTPADGLPSSRLQAVRVAAQVWLATADRGLCATRTGADRLNLAGLAWRCTGDRPGWDVDIRGLAGDASGNAWLCASSGLGVVRDRHLGDWLAGALYAPPVLPFRSGQGTRGRACPAATPLPSYMGGLGEVAFPSTEGALWVRPALVRWPVAPRPWLAALSAGGVALDATTVGALPAGQTSTRLQFVAPDLGWGPVAAMRYRIGEGDWVALPDTGVLELANLRPVEVALRVEALGAAGWGQSLELRVARLAAWHERLLVRLGAVSAAVAGLTGVIVLRGRRLREQNRRLQKHVDAATHELAARHVELARSAAELRLRTAELEAAAALKTAFIANVAHELRTPLMLVIGALDDAEAADPPEAVGRRLRAAGKNAERLSALVRSVVELARLDGARMVLHAKRVELVSFARARLVRFEAAAARGGVTIEVDGEATPPVWLDPELTDTILGNLVGNALSFSPRGSVLRVTVECGAVAEGAPGVVRVILDDAGPGVPIEERERIFERFVQLDSGDSRRREGMGIGLSLSRELAELQGGTLTAADGPTAGARFVLTLPLGSTHLRPEDISPSRADTPEPDAPRASPPGPAHGRPRVLLVEDNGPMREYLQEHLAEVYDVLAVANGAAALAAVRASRPDAIVSDIMMPGIDGLALCARLAADPAVATVPRVLISAKAGPTVEAEALAVATAFLGKPFRMGQLLDLLAPLVARGAAAPSDAEALPAPQGLRRLEAAADARLDDPELGPAGLARLAGMSPRALQRLMGALGTTANRWLRERRLRHAQGLLRSGQSVKQAAAAVGVSRAYFSRAYTAWCGTNPADERGG